MGMMPQLFPASVMHKRTLPKVNQFNYGVYYLACPLSKLDQLSDGWRFGVERKAILSFYAKDHGEKNGAALEHWARGVLDAHGLSQVNGEIVLICMPRVLGYVFNPVSFWMCFDKQEKLRAVICEVNNTFGESHSYICAHEDGRELQSDDWLEAQKLFHVSPFLKRVGHYRFRFALKDEALGIWIDFYNEDAQKQLLTSLSGKLIPYTAANRRSVFWRHPLVTMKTIFLIHWQALKIISKNLAYIPKPEQKEQRTSRSHDLTKM